MRILSSLAVIAAPLALYWFVIRPRLAPGGRAAAIRDGVLSRLRAFQTLIVGTLGLLAAELPTLLAELKLVDWGALLPDDWARTVATIVVVALIAVRAFSTTPAGRPPSGEA